MDVIVIEGQLMSSLLKPAIQALLNEACSKKHGVLSQSQLESP